MKQQEFRVGDRVRSLNLDISYLKQGTVVDEPDAAPFIPVILDGERDSGYFGEDEIELVEEPSDFTIDDFEQKVLDVYNEARFLLLKKHHDYGPKNISQSPGGALNGLRVRLHDKFARIDNLMASGAKPANESLRDSWLDSLNYCAIALLVLDGNWPDD